MKGIVIFGGRGAGKDELTRMLLEKIPNAEQLRLAEFVVIAAKAFGIEKPTKTDLTFIGHEVGRKMFGDDVWLKQAIKKVENNPEKLYIISDVRYPNEYETFVEKLGFLPILIECEELERIKRVVKRDGSIDLEVLKHPNEQMYKQFMWEVLIDNNGTIEELEEQVNELLEWYEGEF